MNVTVTMMVRKSDSFADVIYEWPLRESKAERREERLPPPSRLTSVRGRTRRSFSS